MHGVNITLEARDSIGEIENSFLVEETGRDPERVATPYLVGYDGDKGKTPFQGIIEIQTAERFEDLTAPDGTLYTDPYTDVDVILIDSEGNRIAAQMSIADLRELYALSAKDGTAPKVTFGVMDVNGKQTGSAANLGVRLDWLRPTDETKGTELNAIAHNGDLYLTERTGDIGAGEIRAAGDAVINAETGTIATEEERSTVAVGGAMTVNAQGDVNFITEGNLTLNLNTDTNHVEIENDESHPGSITVVSESEAPLTGTALSNGSVTLINGGDIGTDDEAFEIATDAEKGGTTTLKGDDINVEQKDGDMIVDEIVADGDLNLDVDGGISDAGNTGLGDTIDRVVEAQKALTEAERNLVEAEQVLDLQNYDDHVEAAVKKLADATDALYEARQEAANKTAAADAARAGLAAAQADYEQALEDNGNDPLNEEVLTATRVLEAAQAVASEAQAAEKQAQKDLAAAEKAQAAAEKALPAGLDLEETLKAYEEAKANGASEEELAALLKDAVDAYQKDTPKVKRLEAELENANAAVMEAEEAVKAAEEALAAAQTEEEKAVAEQTLAEAKTALAEAKQAQKDAGDALDQAKADTTAAQAAVDEAQLVYDHAKEALAIAEDALEAQVAANDARRETEAAEEALKNAETEEEKAEAQAALEQAQTKLNAEE